MRSLRLRLLTAFFISEPILLYKLKNESVLLYGTDVRNRIRLRELNVLDRLRCFSVSSLVLSLAPLSLLDPIKFKIWCLKAIKYNNSCIESYIQIALHDPNIGFSDLNLSQTGQELSKKFRYHPKGYSGGLITLYFQSWLNLFHNLPFIWQGEAVFNVKSVNKTH